MDFFTYALTPMAPEATQAAIEQKLEELQTELESETVKSQTLLNERDYLQNILNVKVLELEEVSVELDWAKRHFLGIEIEEGSDPVGSREDELERSGSQCDDNDEDSCLEECEESHHRSYCDLKISDTLACGSGESSLIDDGFDYEEVDVRIDDPDNEPVCPDSAIESSPIVPDTSIHVVEIGHSVTEGIDGDDSEGNPEDDSHVRNLTGLTLERGGESETDGDKDPSMAINFSTEEHDRSLTRNLGVELKQVLAKALDIESQLNDSYEQLQEKETTINALITEIELLNEENDRLDKLNLQAQTDLSSTKAQVGNLISREESLQLQVLDLTAQLAELKHSQPAVVPEPTTPESASVMKGGKVGRAGPSSWEVAHNSSREIGDAAEAHPSGDDSKGGKVAPKNVSAASFTTTEGFSRIPGCSSAGTGGGTVGNGDCSDTKDDSGAAAPPLPLSADASAAPADDAEEIQGTADGGHRDVPAKGNPADFLKLEQELIASKMELAHQMAANDELQMLYRALEKHVCTYKLQVASLQAELDDKNAEIANLRLPCAVGKVVTVPKHR